MSAPLYTPTPVALLRAATSPLAALPHDWPDLTDLDSCRAWLDRVLADDQFATAVTQSTGLAHTLARLHTDSIGANRIRRATKTIARFLLRASGRPTPHSTWAGVAPVDSGPAAVRWGSQHRLTARPDADWLRDLITTLETSPLLEHLTVVRTDLRTIRGDQVEIPNGQNRVQLGYSPAVKYIDQLTRHPTRVHDLLDALTQRFPTGDRAAARALVNELIHHGLLITSLRAPSTVTDPLGHLITTLSAGHPDPGPGDLLTDLTAIHDALTQHNAVNDPAERAALRQSLTTRMRVHSAKGRSPLALDLRLDCDLRIPRTVAHDAARGASALLRLSRHPHGHPIWRQYHRLFCDRYGLGTVVPLADVLCPAAGLGYPASYPGSGIPEPMQPASPRDSRLLALAWSAFAEGDHEIVLTEASLRAVTGNPEITPPPHVEIAVRIQAESLDALDNGTYTLAISPARAGGTLTGRFLPLTGHDLDTAYVDLPPSTADAVRAQLSFAPRYPFAENISRVPAYLTKVLPLGEHPTAATTDPIELGDLAVTATRDRLHLVSASSSRVVEPEVLHALALDKQPPVIVRFLAHLSRGYDTTWTRLDWGPAAADLPFLPRVRFANCVLAPARWRITGADLPPAQADLDAACITVDNWRRKWRCPITVELHDDDRPLRLTLSIPAHVALLRDHVEQHGHADLTEAVQGADLGWLGHAHEIAIPLRSSRPSAPHPVLTTAPRLTNRGGQLPAAPDARWLSIKVFTHPERMNHLISNHIPALLRALGGDPSWWFIRYRSEHEADHLRLRIPSSPGNLDRTARWASHLHDHGLTGRVTFDTYHPESGRYGEGQALDAAEQVFAADSIVAFHILDQLAQVPPPALAAAGMIHTARDFLGPTSGARWLTSRRPVMQAASPARLDPALVVATTTLSRVDPTTPPPEWSDALARAWRERGRLLRQYAGTLPGPSTDNALESLLHMHHNRVVGVDPDNEHLARRLARQVMQAAQARCEV
ncbi:lantibiotic dehydratase [Actinokineospora enzanensis]|uniref:lantibiotic dehydratase n=1 Tax=Actinokineospora enzanensis TaxID=155975 RepID=UPI000378EDF9|nr:lantibiotic dehydratase [Actinokineospora enzanensis]